MTNKNKKKNKILIAIPARLKSTRLKHKLLRRIHGIPMIIRVAKNAIKTNLGEVVVATDSKRILNICNLYKVSCVLTDLSHPSGTDRIFEAYKLKKKKFDLVINLQGDLPCFERNLLSKTIDLFKDKRTQIGSAVCDLTESEINDLNIVKAKVLLDKDDSGFAIDFKRKVLNSKGFYHHIGIYIYKPEILEKFVKYPPSINEKNRKLEQMRALDNSIKIKLVKLKHNPPSIDTKTDLKKIRSYMKKLI